MISHPVFFKVQNLGKSINTNANDFDAVTSDSGNSLVYISSLKFYDALFYSNKKNGAWSKPANITPDVKSDGDYYPTGMSFDGTQLLLTRNDKFNSNLYLSKLVDGKWTPVVKLPKHINTKFWESHASFSPDGKTIYFTSNRTGGYGGLDIYKSSYNEKSQIWLPAVNLGPVINTQFNEETPFICKDNKTLYFASQGHKTMGGFDIFSSTLMKNHTWSDPVNIGYPINTSDDNMFFLPLEEGIKGIMSLTNQKENYGNKDIYLLEIYSDKNPRPVAVTGRVTLNGQPPAKETGILVSIQKPDGGAPVSLTVRGSDGRFSTIENEPGIYKISFVSKGFQTNDQSFTLPSDYSLKQLVVNANLKSIEVKVQPVILPIIYFNFNSSFLSRDGKAKVKELAGIMKENPDLQIEIIGYTDNTGPKVFNNWISKRRAASVGNYLIKYGIAKNRFVSKGLGASNFIAINQYPDNTDAHEGRKFNRRVEIHIISTSNKAIISEKPEIPAKLKFHK